MSLRYSQSLHQIVALHRGRCAASKQINSILLLPLPATPMELRRRTSFSSGNQRSHDALVDKARSHVGDDDEPEVVPPSIKGMIEACQKLEEDCFLVGTEGALDFVDAAFEDPASRLKRFYNIL